MHAAYSPDAFFYHRHLAGTKEEFDPGDLSDATFYVNRERTEQLMRALEAGEDIDMRPWEDAQCKPVAYSYDFACDVTLDTGR